MTAPPDPPALSHAASPRPARVAVIGSGPLAAEVLRNLQLVGIPATVHGPGDYWQTLRLADLQDCYCAVAAGLTLPERRRLNALCQVASVDFVCVATGSHGLVVETFPFGSDPGCACLECDSLPDAGPPDVSVADPIAASIAGALAAAAALHCADQGTRRLHVPEVNQASTLVELQRRGDCGACGSPWRAPHVVRTRNRWAAGEFLAADAPSLAAQVVRLSEPIVTACECAACGPLAALVNRPMTEAAAQPACPGCGADSVRIEARDTFSLGELGERFRRGPVPVKFALAEIGGTAVCFDLEPAVGEPGGTA